MKTLHPPTTVFDAVLNDGDTLIFARYVTLFVTLALALPPPSKRALSSFAQRLSSHTQHQVQLLLNPLRKPTPTLTGRAYGSLHFLHVSPAHAFSLALLEGLGETCGWLLHTLENDVYLQRHHASLPAPLPSKAALRPQEQKVLALMVQGYSTPEIAQRLTLKLRTVEHYQHHLYGTLGVDNAEDAAYLGLCLGMLSEP
jgi:DNA-binding CsgD family transcriptional regulator